MADIIPFQKIGTKNKQPKNIVADKSTGKRSGNTLCKSNFHKWKVDTNTDFAVKQGKLLTRYVCVRCGKTKNEST